MSRAPDLAARPTPPPVLLVGNPNVGKSVIFGALTRTYVTVANYPGTTVEITRGRALSLPGAPEVIDAPGTNSLTPQSDDERVARDLLLAEPEAVVLQVGDTKNLRRVLYLTAQLGELGRRQLLVLNLQDEARDLGVRVEAQRAGAPARGPGDPRHGHPQPGARCHPAAASTRRPWPASSAPTRAVVERAVLEIAALLPEELGNARRGVALMLLSGDRTFAEWARGALREGGSGAGRAAAARARTGARHQRRHCNRPRPPPGGGRASPAGVSRPARRAAARCATGWGDLSMHPVWGVPVLAAVLFLAYEFVGVFGAGTLVETRRGRALRQGDQPCGDGPRGQGAAVGVGAQTSSSGRTASSRWP